MIIGFIIWSIVSSVSLGIGIRIWKSDKTVGFYSGVTPPKVRDIRKYNHSVAVLWFVYAVLFELFGIPFLFLKQNSAGFLWVVLGVAAISLSLMIAYQRILSRFEQKQ